MVADRASAPSAPRICVDASSPTASIDRGVARAALAVMHASAAIAPYDGSSGVSDGFFRFLARKRCALVMGFPVDRAAPDPPGGLALTRAYLRTGYVVATLGHADGIAALGHARGIAELPRGAMVAVGSGTPPHFYLAGSLGPAPSYHADVYATQDEALDALVRRADPAALVWQPSVVRYGATHPNAPHLVTAPLPIDHGAWSLAALYDPRNQPFAKRFDDALAALRASGALAKLTRSVHLEPAS